MFTQAFSHSVRIDLPIYGIPLERVTYKNYASMVWINLRLMMKVHSHQLYAGSHSFLEYDGYFYQAKRTFRVRGYS